MRELEIEEMKEVSGAGLLGIKAVVVVAVDLDLGNLLCKDPCDSKCG